MSEKIETIEIHGESSVDWQATAMRYIELNRQNVKAIQRVREMHGPIDIDGDLECRECPMSAYPCRTIRALDGEQS